MTAAKRYYRLIEKDRYAWRDEMRPRCMKCFKKFDGWRWPEIHEIEKRSQAPLSWGKRCNYLLICHPCHEEFHENAEWTHAQQLAIKLRMDPKHYDLAAWLAIKPRPETYVTEDEVRRAS